MQSFLILKIVDGVLNNGFSAVMTQKNTRYPKNERKKKNKEKLKKKRKMEKHAPSTEWRMISQW